MLDLADLAKRSLAAAAVLQLGGDSRYERLIAIEPGSGEIQTALTSLSPKTLLSSPPADMREAECLVAALWLWHDFLDQVHRIVQDVATPTGSYWHAIMHRREGDFSNSKYWYARAAGHPAEAAIAARVSELIRLHPADKSIGRIISNGWNPAAFVDLIEAVHDQPSDARHSLAVAIQRLEWRVMFETGIQRALD